MTQMKQEQEIMGMVTDIQRFSVHDGPGTVSYTHLDVYKRQIR